MKPPKTFGLPSSPNPYDEEEVECIDCQGGDPYCPCHLTKEEGREQEVLQKWDYERGK